MSKTAIVIVATGLVGQALVDRLAKASHIKKIVSITRRPVQHSSVKVTNHVVDFDHLEKSASLFTGHYLFSCLGTTRKQAGSIEAQRKVDYDYQYAAAKLAAKNGVQHYLLVSSSGANKKSSNPYLKMKGELEESVLSLPFERISIFQPSLLVGTRATPRFGEKVASKILPFVCLIPGLHRYRPIRGDQVAAKMVQVSKELGSGCKWFRLDKIFID